MPGPLGCWESCRTGWRAKRALARISTGGQRTPFFRRGLAAAEGPILDVLKGGIDPKKMVVDSRTAEAVGLVTQNAIQRESETSESWAVINAESTIEAKGSSGPLRDTGLLRNSLTYKVEK